MGLSMLALVLAPTLYLVVPLLLPLDLVPRGLKEAVAPTGWSTSAAGASSSWRSPDVEGAIDRAAATSRSTRGARTVRGGTSGRRRCRRATRRAVTDNRARPGR